MSEEEYKELYLKYKVKYINLKNNNKNNMSGGGLLDYIKWSTATDADIDRIDKEYNDEMKAKIFKELQKLVSKIKVRNHYNKDIDPIVGLLTNKFDKNNNKSNQELDNYININYEIKTWLESIQIYYEQIQSNKITKDEYITNMYELCKEMRASLIEYINNDNNKFVIQELKTILNNTNFKYNIFKNFLFLTEDENRFIYLMLIHGPSTQTSSDKTIFQTYYQSAINQMKINKYSIRQVKIKMKCFYENIYKNNYNIIYFYFNEELFNKCV